jgi:hypothetical protein
MSISATYDTLRQIASVEFDDIVVYTEVTRLPTGDPLKLRLNLVDSSFIDIYLSVTGRYSYHWERRFTGKNELYRHDNAPHKKWRSISTYPRHFHGCLPLHPATCQQAVSGVRLR